MVGSAEFAIPNMWYERLIYLFMKNKTVAPVHLLFQNRLTSSGNVIK